MEHLLFSGTVLGSAQGRSSPSTHGVYLSRIDDKQPTKQVTSDSDKCYKDNQRGYLTRNGRGWLMSISSQEWYHQGSRVKCRLPIDRGLEMSNVHLTFLSSKETLSLKIENWNHKSMRRNLNPRASKERRIEKWRKCDLQWNQRKKWFKNKKVTDEGKFWGRSIIDSLALVWGRLLGVTVPNAGGPEGQWREEIPWMYSQVGHLISPFSRDRKTEGLN